jgi:hypothetical protein
LGVGSLYRFVYSGTNSTSFPLYELPSAYYNFRGLQLGSLTNSSAKLPANITTNINRIIDGVVDFRVRVYDTNGAVRPKITTIPPYPWVSGMFYLAQPAAGAGEYNVYFDSNAVPASVELKMGVLEDRTLERLRTLTNSYTAAVNYLSNHIGQVHVVQQRISVRSVDPTVYH